jgi:hypothetical protein
VDAGVAGSIGGPSGVDASLGAGVGVGIGDPTGFAPSVGLSRDSTGVDSATTANTGLAAGPNANAGVGLSSPSASGAAMKIAVKRLCPSILADPSAYDDKLVLLCRKVARL